MTKIAASQGFDAKTLLTRDATRANVLAELSKAADTLTSGDIFMLSVFRPGGQLPDLNRDEIDAQDETWCLFDGEMVDDEVNEAYAKFEKGFESWYRTARHSGTVTKEADLDGEFPQVQARKRCVIGICPG